MTAQTIVAFLAVMLVGVLLLFLGVSQDIPAAVILSLFTFIAAPLVAALRAGP